MNTAHETPGTARRWIWGGLTGVLLGSAALLFTLNGTAVTGQSQAEAAPAQTPQAKAAPELVGKEWLNTPNKAPISLASRRGKVTIVEFWTFGCSNCQANLPAYARLQKQFAGRGVEVIGVHTPETEGERNPQNVARRVKELGITYPVLLDPQRENWNRWNQQYWPTVYVLDKAGVVRTKWEGELAYNGAGGEKKISGLVEQLLKEPAPAVAKAQGGKVVKISKTPDEWRKILTPVQFNILREAGTEAAFSGDYHPRKEVGVYRCTGCNLELFQSKTQFDSGTGWPSFYQAIVGHVENHTDSAYGMTRTEVVCARCGGHLGHVFDDGPQPTGLRYCMNSPALKFEKK